jgi:EmrB/QacA subfamily drug resistance transporter
MSTATVANSTTSPAPAPTFTHQQILKIMTGLLAGLFTALLSSTIVSTALPTIMSDLHGTQRQYTWVITASLLTMTISTPIWGKLSDLFSKKFLIQLSIVLFVAGSIGAGLSQTVPVMMIFRAVQGVAMGGLIATAQSIMGAIIPPRERGRYSGYMGAVMAVSTVSGPLLGGVITDHINWRWCFFVCVPVAIVSLILLQITLKLPTVHRKVKIDYVGAVLIAIVAALPMLWVTFAGTDYAWISWQSALYLGGFLVAVVLAIITELKVSEPMVPIRLLNNSTTALMIIASIGVGVAMFGSSTFLTQYFQLAGGHTPTQAGLMTIPLIIAQMLTSTIGGQLVTRTGRWKPLMVFGSILLVIGLAGLSTIDHETPYWLVAISMAVMGIGVGALIQNIVLAVQNTVDVRQIGATSATVSFFRSLGGAVGVAVLGALLANHVQSNVASGLKAAGVSAGGQAGADLDLSDLPGPIQAIVRAAYGDSFGLLFLIAAGFAVVTLIAVVLVKEVPLRTTIELKPQPVADGVAEHLAENAEPTNTEPTNAELHDISATRMNRPNDFDGAALDDPAERLSVAALDVLSAARDQARQVSGEQSSEQVRARLDQVSHEVDAAVARFHAELDQIRSGLATEPSRASGGASGRGGDSLRAYEYGLLLSAQQTAERVTTLARNEAERILTTADTEVAALEKRIAALRQAEADLSARVSQHLQHQD